MWTKSCFLTQIFVVTKLIRLPETPVQEGYTLCIYIIPSPLPTFEIHVLPQRIQAWRERPESYVLTRLWHHFRSGLVFLLNFFTQAINPPIETRTGPMVEVSCPMAIAAIGWQMPKPALIVTLRPPLLHVVDRLPCRGLPPRRTLRRQRQP